MKSFISIQSAESKLSPKDEARTLMSALLIALVTFSFPFAYYAYGEAVNITVSIQSTLSFTTSTDQFGNLTPAVPLIATTTLDVSTNNTDGWNITLYGDDQGTSNTVMDLDTDAAIGITDDTEWVPNAATTSAGNATNITSGDDVLAFRVMTASGSIPFRADQWWGTSDANYNASQLWAGIASSTVSRQIGNAGAGSYSASAHLNTVQYYLDVPATQQTGDYTGPLTYTATAN